MIELIVRLFVLAILFGSLIPGCVGREMPVDAWKDGELTKAWPPPPDSPKIELLRTVQSEFDVKGGSDRNAFLAWLLGHDGDELPLVSPYGVAADGAGRVWVADPGNSFVKNFDLARKNVSYISMAGGISLVTPVGVVYDQVNQHLFVSDSSLGKVFKYDSGGNLLLAFSPPGGFGRPAGMALSADGNLFVVDAANGTIEVFDPQHNWLRKIGSAVAEDGRFRHPSNVAIDASGRVYIVDSLRFRVEIQEHDGSLVGLIGGVGDRPGSFARPRGIAVDSNGHIYVADAAFDNIQIFDLTGQLLLYFGRPGEEPGDFCLPAGVAIDANDRIYVAEACNQRFQIFQYHK